MIQRVAATFAATLILWFVWWFLAWALAALLASVIGFDIASAVTGVLFWVVVVAIPPLLWFRFRHVQKNPDR